MDAMGRGRTRAVAVAVLLTCAGAGVLPAMAAHGEAEAELITTIAGRGSNETRETIPITQTRGAQPFVVLSERVNAGGGLRRGDILRATAELQLSTTCVLPEPRCIGSRYSYSPRMDAQVVLASSPTATGGSNADPISNGQDEALQPAAAEPQPPLRLRLLRRGPRVRNAGNLPCPPDACFLNVIASADHHNAGAGDLVIVGADRPDGSVDGDKARIDGLLERGDVPPPQTRAGGQKMRDTVPITPSGDGPSGQRVVRSLRLDGLRKGDVIRISAEQRIGISSVPYNVFIGTRMIVATSPTETRTNGFVANVISSGGEVTEQNGFNCTQGGSAHQDPCNAPKAATASSSARCRGAAASPSPCS